MTRKQSKVEIRPLFPFHPLVSLERRRLCCSKRTLERARSLQCILSKVWTVFDTYPSSDDEGDLDNCSTGFSADRHARSQTISNDTISRQWKWRMSLRAHGNFISYVPAQDRLSKLPTLSRALESIINVHEFHIFKNECFLVEDYHGQGTLLDLVNIVRTEGITNSGSAEAGMDEVWPCSSPWSFQDGWSFACLWNSPWDIKPDNCLVRFEDETSAPISTAPTDLSYWLRWERTRTRTVRSPLPRLVALQLRKKGLTLIDLDELSICVHSARCPIYRRLEGEKHECKRCVKCDLWTHQIDLYGLQNYPRNVVW